MILMWTVAVVVYFCCKIVSLIPARSSSLKLKLAYFLWVGLDANAFIHSKPTPIQPAEWYFSILNTIIGCSLLFFNNALTTIVGIIFLLHFGLFHFLSLMWRDGRPKPTFSLGSCARHAPDHAPWPTPPIGVFAELFAAFRACWV